MVEMWKPYNLDTKQNNHTFINAIDKVIFPLDAVRSI